MPKRSTLRLTKRTVDALVVETKDTLFRDRTLTGFGVRVYPTGGKVYVAQARGPKGPKRVTVGRHGVLTAEQARQRAARLIARVKAGEAPTPEPLTAPRTAAPTVRVLAERFLAEYAAVRYKLGTDLGDRVFHPRLGGTHGNLHPITPAIQFRRFVFGE